MCKSGLKGGLDLSWRYTRMGLVKQRFITVLFLTLMTITHSTLASHAVLLRSDAHVPSLSSRAADNSSLLQCLQVASPVFSPASGCQTTLMVHTFAYSYGQPFVGKSDHNQTYDCSITSRYREHANIIPHTDIWGRQLRSTKLQLQSYNDQFYCHFCGSAIRPTCFDVFRRL